jgi:hypothetical protein
MFRRQDALLVVIVRHNLLHAQGSQARDGRRMLQFAGLVDPRFPDASRLAKQLHGLTASPVIAALCLGHLLLEGPKFFEFTARDCEALENFSLDLPVEEYGQPFPTLMVKLPPDYAEARVERIQNYGQVPDWVIAHHNGTHNLVLVSLRFRSGHDAAYHLAMDRPGLTVEGVWQEFRQELLAHAPDPLRDLVELAQSLVRLALSSCLMVMVYGASRVGPDNQGHVRRLERHVQAARKSGNVERLKNAEFDLRSVPIRYRFAQDVRLYRTELSRDRADGGEPTGRTLSPHWRRGHYRMQPYGPGLTQRRRIAVPAVLVNCHLFVGDRAEASATYHP